MTTKTPDQLLRIRIEGPQLENFDFDLAVNTWGKMKNRRINVF